MRTTAIIVIAAVAVFLLAHMDGADHSTEAGNLIPEKGTLKSEFAKSSATHDLIALAPEKVSIVYQAGGVRKLGALNAFDLFQAYKKGLTSIDIADKYIAAQALSYCLPSILNRNIANPPWIKLYTRVEVMQARDALSERCKFFAAADRIEILASEKLLDKQVAAPDSPMNPASFELRRGQIDEAEVKAAQQVVRGLLDRFGADALLWVAPALETLMERELGRARNSSTIDPVLTDGNLSAAINIAMCQLEFPCGKDSIIYMNLCTAAFQCGESVDEQIISHIEDQHARLRVLHQAKVIVEAISQKQYERLGL